MVTDKISATSTRVNDTVLDEFGKLFEFLLFIRDVSDEDVDNLSENTERIYMEMHQASGAMSIITITISQLSS